MNTARRTHLVDIGEVSRMLAARIQSLAPDLFPHGQRRGAEYVVGSLAGEVGDNLSIRLTGGKAGVWKDFVANVSGDSLDLVAQTLFRGEKSGALTWSRRWLGLDTGDAAALETARRETPTPAQADAKSKEDAEQARSGAFRIWLAGEKQIRDTPVDTYLRGRGISLAELGRAPGAIRFHSGLWHQRSGRSWPAMVTQISGPEGFMACHRTWLEIQSDGSVKKAPVEPNKAVLGAYRTGHIALWRGASGKPLAQAEQGETCDLSEGIEDGLSVAIVAPECRVVAAVALANMAAIVLPPAITAVRIWKQNDEKAAAVAAFDRAVLAHMAAGREVIIPEIPRHLKDVNDLLRAEGNG